MRRRGPGRALAQVLVTVVVAGCASTGLDARPEAPMTESTSGEVTTTRPTTTTTPPVSRFDVDPTEVGAEPKAAAVQLVEAAINHDAGSTQQAREAALAATADPTAIAAVLDSIAPTSLATRGEVIYPQLGGYGATRSSVMVVTRILALQEGAWTETTRTLDVRVDLIDDTWRVVDIASNGGAAPTTPPPPPAAVQELLSNPAVTLPDSARWDLMTGAIDPRVVEVINALAEQHTLSVTVMMTGHPVEVFGASSLSNHTRGQGVDIWEVDGRSVFDSREDVSSGARLVVEQAVALGATEVGSPWDPDGPGGVTFANALHQDHLHLAFD